MSANARIAVGAQRDEATNGLTMADHEALERALTYCRTERAGRSQELDAKLASDGAGITRVPTAHAAFAFLRGN